MAAKLVKKKINQTDLRRLMKERNENFVSNEKNIESPLAKYDSDGRLSCIACNEVIKSGTLWRHHILSKSHKKNVTEKLKRKHAEVVPCDAKKEKVETVPCLKTQINVGRNSEGDVKRIGGNSVLQNGVSLLQGYSSDEDDDEEAPTSTSSVSQAPVSNALPPDFFDSPTPSNPAATNSSETPSNQEIFKPSTSKDIPEALPEGFFDDPVLDAQARQVQYKNPMDEEWEKFQRTMAEETNVSQSIMEEDIEQSVAERDIDEIDQKMFYLKKVIVLQSKADERKTIQPQTKKVDDVNISEHSDSEEDDRLLEELLDWRAKKVW